MATSQVRQNFHRDSEAGVNKLINQKLAASYVYHAMAYHFDRDDVALKGFHEFYKKLAHEKREWAEKLMKFQNQRGGRIVLQNIQKPAEEDWINGQAAMESALQLEKSLNQATLDLHKISCQYADAQMCDWLENHFLTEQVELIKKIGDHITNLKRVGTGLGEYMFNHETLEG